MPGHFENGENVTVAKFQPAFTRCRNNVKTVGNLTVKNSLQNVDAKEVYLHPENRSVSLKKSLVKKASTNVLFSSFQVFTRRLFQKCAG